MFAGEIVRLKASEVLMIPIVLKTVYFVCHYLKPYICTQKHSYYAGDILIMVQS